MNVDSAVQYRPEPAMFRHRRSGVRVRLVAGPLLLAAAGIAACGPEESSETGSNEPLYEVSALVLEAPDRPPMVCPNVADSYPPQCSGPEVVGWDWEAVDNEESASGVTWGEYHVVGTWDGAALTLTQPPEPPEPEEQEDIDFTSPCPEPAGGWVIRDPSRVSEALLQEAIGVARADPGYAGEWLDHSRNPVRADGEITEAESAGVNDPMYVTINAKTTGDTSALAAAMEAVWGGPVCVTGARHTHAELEAVLTAVGHEVHSASISVLRNVVGLTTTVADEPTIASFNERFGPGIVEVHGFLQPVATDEASMAAVDIAIPCQDRIVDLVGGGGSSTACEPGDVVDVGGATYSISCITPDPSELGESVAVAGTDARFAGALAVDGHESSEVIALQTVSALPYCETPGLAVLAVNGGFDISREAGARWWARVKCENFAVPFDDRCAVGGPFGYSLDPTGRKGDGRRNVWLDGPVARINAELAAGTSADTWRLDPLDATQHELDWVDPESPWLHRVGLRIVSAEPGRVVVEVVVQDANEGQSPPLYSTAREQHTFEQLLGGPGWWETHFIVVQYGETHPLGIRTTLTDLDAEWVGCCDRVLVDRSDRE